MKRQHNTYLTDLILGTILLAFAILGCEEAAPLDPVVEPIRGSNSEIIGTWIQRPVHNEGNQERTLIFSSRVATLIYPDTKGVCGGDPLLFKQFEWDENAKSAGKMNLKTVRHIECGITKQSGQEETLSYDLQKETLRIFSHTWVRTGASGRIQIP